MIHKLSDEFEEFLKAAFGDRKEKPSKKAVLTLKSAFYAGAVCTMRNIVTPGTDPEQCMDEMLEEIKAFKNTLHPSRLN